MNLKYNNNNNQDETPLSPGVEHQRVLTEKGWDGPVYNTGGDSRKHITSSVTVSADGEYVGVRLALGRGTDTSTFVTYLTQESRAGDAVPRPERLCQS